ncbi:MAG: ABC transporter permease [Cellulomonadaceae bacterium]|jgi:ABC-2 type transport system permease protein|nr:ABC transporter permease [Cellulomonadaceae bacterium]
MTTLASPSAQTPSALATSDQATSTQAPPTMPQPHPSSANTLAHPGRAGTLAQIGLLIQWQARRAGDMLPFAFIMQIVMAVATIFGFGLLIGDPPAMAARHLATGATTVTLIMLGLVLAPQITAQSKTEGSFDWLRTLPVPRWVFMVADLSLWTLIALPGAAIGALLGAWHFNVSLSVSPWIVVAVPLVALISATVGFSMALLLKPAMAQLMTQFIVFIVLLFSPISFPAANLPGWLAEVHQWLPFQPMAEMIRATLMSDEFSMPLRSVIVLVVWTVLAVVGATRALSQRN